MNARSPACIWLLTAALLAGCSQTLFVAPQTLSDREFSKLSMELSEEPGFFDTDNLISNENSYQHVVPALRRLTQPGGVYLGVGPDQNFTYIAHTRPGLAFIVDVRRDNLLQHLYLKELFHRSENRWQYLSNLLGRPLAAGFEPDPGADADKLCRHFESLAADVEFSGEVFNSVWESLRRRFPELVDEQDRATLERLSLPFVLEGLQLKFRSYGRTPRRSYPTFGELLRETDLEGHQNSYLASDDSYAVIRRMQLDNLIIPVVGDLAGPSALRRIGDYLREHDLEVSCFYTSNVEFYLFNNQTFDQFAANLASLPISDHSWLIRSYFSYWRRPHPETVPGYPVTSLLQPLPVFLRRQKERPRRDYLELIFYDFVPILSAR